MTAERFQDTHYLLAKTRVSLMVEFSCADSSGAEVLYGRQERHFDWTMDLFANAAAAGGQPEMRIKPHQKVNLGGQFDLYETGDGGETLLGSFKRKMMASMLRDDWLVFDAAGVQIGELLEDSLGMAIIRRTVAKRTQQSFYAEIGGVKAATYHRQAWQFNQTTKIEFPTDPLPAFDRRMGLVAGMLLGMLDTEQTK